MSQQPPYNPNNPFYQYPPGYQPTPILPPPPPKQRNNPKQVWTRASKRGKIGLLALCLVLPVSMCICASVATASTSSSVASLPTRTATQVPTVRPTHQPTRVATKAPTQAPTPKPTMKPTPLPTKAPVVQAVLPTPTQAPIAPTQPPVQTGVNGNPWGYNFTAGTYIYSPAAGFCDYFTCVSTFWTKTNGYVAECYNGSYTHSGGISGACSRDGGVEQPLYSH